jgi:hypothetical protein
MMYEAGTILTRKEQIGTAAEPHAYDRIEVIGVSPVNHSFAAGSEWAGALGTGVLIKPAGETFGSNLDVPFGELQQKYDVDFIPEREELIQPQVRRFNATSAAAGRTPEEVFAAAAVKPKSGNAKG